MFENRVRVLLVVIAAAALMIVVRLVDLQLVHGAYFSERASRAMLLRPRPLPFVRGSILDRTGAMLAWDEPCWDLQLEYDVIAATLGQGEVREEALRRCLRRYQPGEAPAEERAAAFFDRVDTMWVELTWWFSTPERRIEVPELRGRAQEIHERIQAIRQQVEKRRGFDSPVAEERQSHTIIESLDPDAQIVARERLDPYPWLQVEASKKRSYPPDSAPFAHVLGRTGRVDAEAVANDPNADDPFARYRADEQMGISGIELSQEQRLRGRRGQIAQDRTGQLTQDVIEAQHGNDVVLTIHADLQHRLYDLLEGAVLGVPQSAGGAIVVLHVPTREVLALVSYPAYDPARFDEVYAGLRDDTVRLPLWFRAVASRYPPGSTIKPLACLAGLMNNKISVDTRIECTGYLFPENREGWRCWQIRGTDQRVAHGPVNLTEALTGSCNIFMYKLGEALGVNGLCTTFDMVGIGRNSGIELKEASKGINPTPDWLIDEKGTPASVGHARNFAIGQGELSLTPVQVANLMATYADGHFQPVTLARGTEPKPRWRLPLTPEQWLAVKRGIYGVVNDLAGTAYHHAHFVDPDYVLCGKTGSATAYPWPTAYAARFTDESGAEWIATVPAGSHKTARERFARDYPDVEFDPESIEVARRWPDTPAEEGEHAHAWFGGFLQPRTADGEPDWSRTPEVAFAVLVEFGGSGGRISGPLAKAVAAELLAVFGRDLDVNAPGPAGEAK